jgi:hypothetical protein
MARSGFTTLAASWERWEDRAMTDRVSPFISELIRAANETEKLTKPERARLLGRAAATLRDYRSQINYSETPANDGGPNDAPHRWSEMARLIYLFSAGEVAEELLDAADLITTARMLMDVKLEISGLPKDDA